MQRIRSAGIIFILALLACSSEAGEKAAGDSAVDKTKAKGNPVVVITTSKGVIKLELDQEKAPITVENFLAYVDDGFYDGTVFHRVIPDFMIQGGGFDADMKQKATRSSIQNEANNGLKNTKGTVAMARTADPNSATAQWFINLKANDFLDHGVRDFGYAVFGKVVDGQDVVDAIGGVATGVKSGMRDVPEEAVVIESVRRE